MIERFFAFFLSFASTVQTNIIKLEQFPFGCACVHFIVAFFVALLAYVVFYPNFAYKTDLVRAVKKSQEISIVELAFFFLYSVSYAILTGIGATAVLAFQSAQINTSSAVIYGMLGPHFLKKQMQNLMMTSTSNNVRKKIDDIEHDKDKDYNEEIEKLLEQARKQ